MRCKGVLDICPEKVDIRLSDCEDYYDCEDCRKKYWLTAEKEWKR
uniref:RNAse domain protein n=1 Tax=Siphoviridae sp. ct3R43 TaxID=2825321 RepID=A0A8S5VFX1_9CAUD|nr:MAG TPA: RNAse domain protein [Siphoviridae sp. ct3R43]